MQDQSKKTSSDQKDTFAGHKEFSELGVSGKSENLDQGAPSLKKNVNVPQDDAQKTGGTEQVKGGQYQAPPQKKWEPKHQNHQLLLGWPLYYNIINRYLRYHMMSTIN